MSGIVAIVGDSDLSVDDILDRMPHRGENLRSIKHFEGFGSLGTNLFMIQDPENGRQPLFNEDGSIACVMNGEIYNHRALRRDLAQRHDFRSLSDAEVLLHLYEEYGDDLVEFLDGMFAFVLFDLKQGRFIAARDPLGIKPLWYRIDGQRTVIASEAKALRGFEGGDIQELLPGMLLSSSSPPLTYHEHDLKTSEPDHALCRSLLQAAVRKQTVGGSRLGVFLSGGVDSSIIAALAAQENPKIKAYTLGVEGAADVEMARRVADFLDIEHTVRTFTIDELNQVVDEAIFITESYNPSTITSAAVTLLAARAAQEDSVRVILSGDGADELFGGHAAVRCFSYLELKLALEAMLGNLHRTELRRLDSITMSAKIEARVPYLDRDFVEYAFNLPSDEKIHEVGGRRIEKWHLRQSFEGLLPDEFIWRDEMKMDLGSGSANLVPYIESAVSDEEFEAGRQRYAAWNILSKEMLYYFEIWKRHFGDSLQPGRTFEMFGDYPILMSEIADRGANQK